MSTRYGYQAPEVTNTRPEQIIDKNGKHTTVHKRVDTNSVNARVSNAPVPTLAVVKNRPFIDSTPPEVDLALSENYYKQSTAYSSISRLHHYNAENLSSIQREVDKTARSLASATERGDEDAIKLFSRDPEDDYYVKRYRESIAENDKKIAVLEDTLADLRDEAKPYEDEFEARGGWSRFYQVTNSNGHVHSSTRCSTCYASTQFYWHADRSGMTDDQIVDLAGSDACTVCFSDAPVEKLAQPGQLETPDMKTKREERDARELKRAEKAAADLVKGITNPDGTPLRAGGYTIKTERAAEQRLVDDLMWLYAGSDHYEGNPHVEKYEQSAQVLFEALLSKRGGSREEQIELINNKVIAKLKREWKEAIPNFERKFNKDTLR